MQIKSPVIILRTIKYGDSKMIVDTFTRHGGRQTFVVAVPRSGKARVKKQFFQPMMVLSAEYDWRPKMQFQRFTDVVPSFPYHTLYTDPFKLSISLFISEVLCHALRGEQQDEALFDYIVGSMQWLDGSGGSVANFHLVFLMRLSLFLGFYPNLDDYNEGDCFDLRAASFSSATPVHRDFLLPAETSKVCLMMRMSLATMHLFRMSRAERNRLVDIIMTYYQIHLPDFPEMKSLSVVRELFV